MDVQYSSPVILTGVWVTCIQYTETLSCKGCCYFLPTIYLNLLLAEHGLLERRDQYMAGQISLVIMSATIWKESPPDLLLIYYS